MEDESKKKPTTFKIKYQLDATLNLYFEQKYKLKRKKKTKMRMF